MFGRNKIAMIVAEFLGTFSLATAVFVAGKQIDLTFFTALVAGGTAAAMVLAIGSVSGAHINPAVTIGMWTLKKIQTGQAVVYLAAQMLGGAVAWRFTEYMLDGRLPNSVGSEFDMRVFVAEAVGTLVFTFGIAAAVYQGYKGVLQAVTIGTSLTVGIFLAAIGSNGLLNPAVALGIQSWNFTYVAAPVLGSIIGMNLYAQLFAPNLAGVKPVKKRN